MAIKNHYQRMIQIYQYLHPLRSFLMICFPFSTTIEHWLEHLLKLSALAHLLSCLISIYFGSSFMAKVFQHFFFEFSWQENPLTSFQIFSKHHFKILPFFCSSGVFSIQDCPITASSQETYPSTELVKTSKCHQMKPWGHSLFFWIFLLSKNWFYKSPNLALSHCPS